MEERQHTEQFTRDDREIARARQVVTNTLQSWGIDVEVPVIALLVSELVTNALVHGTGHIQVHLASDALRIRLEVTDDDGTRSAPHMVSHEDLGGWGLQLVDRLADSWGVDDPNHTTLVWTETLRSERESPVAPAGA